MGDVRRGMRSRDVNTEVSFKSRSAFVHVRFCTHLNIFVRLPPHRNERKLAKLSVQTLLNAFCGSAQLIVQVMNKLMRNVSRKSKLLLKIRIFMVYLQKYFFSKLFFKQCAIWEKLYIYFVFMQHKLFLSVPGRIILVIRDTYALCLNDCGLCYQRDILTYLSHIVDCIYFIHF